MRELTIDGPCGAIEALLDMPADADCCAIICHPHPLYGGSLHDSCVDILARSLAGCGIGNIRFNFRGVGRSEGEFDQGAGEVEDLLAVERWVNHELSPSRLMLCGYSFGAAVALNAQAMSSATRGIVLAPPVGMIKVPGISFPTLIILGAADTIVAAEAAAAHLKHADATIKVLAERDHFFAGADGEIDTVVQEFVSGT